LDFVHFVHHFVLVDVDDSNFEVGVV